MRTISEATDQFAFHPATDVTRPKHAEVRQTFIGVVEDLWDVVPDGPEKTLMLRSLQQAAMYANLAVALLAPVVYPEDDV